MKAIRTTYPNYQKAHIIEAFRPSQGWVKTLTVQAVLRNIITLKNEGATHVNLRVIDEHGVTKFPDFSIKELLE